MTENVIKVGEYIVIQKQNYKKLHKFNKPDSRVTLGRDSVNLSGIEGCPFFSIFRMVPSNKKGREYKLELAKEAVVLKDEIDIQTSGTDNRNIVDDGRSQKLTAAEIAELASEATTSSHIVGTLISNSKTFQDKTEFSQEKYLKKKEKKYSEFIQIFRPNLRLVTEVMFKIESNKIQNIRIDTLSQIITMSNIQDEGVHLLYDSGSNGLVAAALLSVIGAKTEGKLIHMHPGNLSQKQALQAMNFPQEQMDRCLSVNIYSALRQYYQGCDTHDKTGETQNDATKATEINSLKRKTDDDGDIESKVPRLDPQESVSENHTEISKKEATKPCNTQDHTTKEMDLNSVQPKADGESDIKVSTIEIKVTQSTNSTEDSKKEDGTTHNQNSYNSQKTSEPKKPKWHYDNIAAAELLSQKVDSLVIACKEDPSTIFEELMKFVKPGRPFVVYYSVAEPLQHMYVELKSNPRVGYLKLTWNWMRNYQVLPERTHPEVSMNNQSGFLLTGYIFK